MRIRRAYLYAVALVCLLALLFGLINGTRDLIYALLGATTVPGGTALWWLLAIVGGAIWAVAWYNADRVARTLTIAAAAERNSAARKAYLYIGELVTLVVLAAEGLLLLYNLALPALGQPVSALSPWPARPFAAAVGTVIALALWLHLHRVIGRDGDVGHELEGGAPWRRAYYDLGSALATVTAALGAGEFLRVFLRVVGQAYVFGLQPENVGTSRQLVAISLAAAVVSLPIALLLSYRANRLAVSDVSGAEANALGRKLLLYSGMLVGATMTLLCLGYLIWQSLLLILGQPVANLQSLWDGVITLPLAYLPVGAIIWLAYGSMARGDIAWSPESQDAAVMRRLYYYAMAAIGLAAFWYGLQALLVLVLLVGLKVWTPVMLATSRAPVYFSLATALALVGGPTWWGHWGVEQSLARQRDPVGDSERTSVLRKVYLYGVVLAAVVVAVVSLAVVIYQAPGWLLGPKKAASFMQSLVQLGVAVAMALFWWIAHGFVLRADERLQATAEPAPAGSQTEATTVPIAQEALERPTVRLPRGPADEPAPGSASGTPVAGRGATPGLPDAGLPAPAPAAPAISAGGTAAPVRQPAPPPDEPGPSIAVIDGADGRAGAALLAALAAALPGTTLWPVALNPVAYEAMLAALAGQAANALSPASPQVPPPSLPPDALSRVSIILGPSDAFTPGGLDGEVPPALAAALAASPARKVMLPPRNPRTRWVAAPDWPLERWVAYAVAEVTDALAG